MIRSLKGILFNKAIFLTAVVAEESSVNFVRVMCDTMRKLGYFAGSFHGALVQLLELGHLTVDLLAARNVAGVGKPRHLGMLLLHFLEFTDASLTVGNTSKQLIKLVAVPGWLNGKTFASQAVSLVAEWLNQTAVVFNRPVRQI